MRGTSPL